MSVQFLDQSTCLGSLRKRWAAFTISSLFFVGIGYAGLESLWHPLHALRWLAITSAGIATLSGMLWRNLELNYRPGEGQLLPVLGPGNQLTLLRGVMTAALAGFLFSPRPPGWVAWLPGILYTLAAVADLFDGYLARRSTYATGLGERLDLQLDGLGVLVAAFLVVQYGQAPVWYLLVGFARYLFLAGAWLRRQLGKPVYPLPPSAVRRPLAGAQMGFLSVALLPLFAPPGTQLAAALFALPFLGSFTRDWLSISGLLSQPASPPDPHVKDLQNDDRIFRSSRQMGSRSFTRTLPVFLRVALVAATAISLPAKFNASFNPANSLFSPEHSLVIILFLAGCTLIAVGAAGRVGALMLLFGLGLQQRFAALAGIDLSLLVLATALFFLGTGALSLWTPENRIIEKRLGETLGGQT